MSSFLILILVNLSQANFITKDAFYSDNSNIKILAFLSDLCPCSRSHVEHLNQLQKNYPKFKFYGVISEPPQNPERQLSINSYFTEKNFSFPIINDPDQTLVKKYNALKTPHITILKKNQQSPIYSILYEGGVSNKREFNKSDIRFLEENLKKLQTSNNVQFTNGSSLGCYIRRL